MENTKRKVLITGCSDGSLGAALAVAFHNAGLHVYATARSLAKMSTVASLGIDTLELDVTSPASVAACAGKLSSLDVLVNNAGAVHHMPVVDLDLSEARAIFELNVWAQIAVTQAFLPLLLRSPHGGLIANQTSAASLVPIPFQSVYNASKAAMAMFSENMRLELAVFGIKVVELKTSLVKSGIISPRKRVAEPKLPQGSIYQPAREPVEAALRGDQFQGGGMETQEYADATVGDLLQENPPIVVYRGENAELTPSLPGKPGSTDEMLKALTGLDKVEEIMAKPKH